jgi:HK97 family phage major capsid protein
LGSPSAWGDQLVGYKQLVNGFFESLRGRSAFFAMLQSGALSRTPLKVRFNIATTAVGGAVVAPGRAGPLSSMNFATDTLEPAKAVASVVVTEELLTSAAPSAEAAFGRELRGAVADVVDQHFFDLIGQAVTAESATAGPLADILTLLNLVNTTGNGALYFVMTPSLANTMSTLLGGPGAGRLFTEMTPQGGAICGVPALVSTQVPAAAGSPTQNSLWLIDASGIVANADTIEVSMSRQSLVEMSNPAAQNASGPTAATGPLVSLWQTNSVGIKASVWFGASVVRSNAVAVLQGISW